MRFTLPTLPYDYDALEPYFDKETMNIHHTKHHQTYINNANSVLETLPQFSNNSVEEIIQNLDHIPNAKRTALRNNAGGHANHSLFWKCLKQNTTLTGAFKKAIENDFGSVDIFKKSFEKAAMERFGSGWIWLVKIRGKLAVVSTANQDNPMMGKMISGVEGYPILGLDVWEHAYYLRYQNRRGDYVASFWHVVNWTEAELRFFSQD